MMKNIRWPEILTATRNCLTAIGAAVLGAWFASKPAAWPLAAGLATLALVWWGCYSLAVAVAARRGRRELRRVGRVQERMRRPGKRAVASWAHFVEDVRYEKQANRAGW
jgi:hypothetical protein